MTKKILAALLAVMMIVSLLPATFAAPANTCPGANADHSKDNCSYEKADEPYVEPGCCTPGYQLYVCKVCGEHFASDIVPATAADDCTWKLESAYVAPTCTEAGAWAKYVCEVGQIGQQLRDADGNVVALGTAAPVALGHDYGDIVDCHEGKVCQREDCDYAEAQGKHSWEASFNYDDIVIDIEPTETVDGEFHYVCADCGAESEHFVIVANDHQYIPVTGTPATCGSTGIRDHFKCATCDKLFIEITTGGVAYKQVVTRDKLIIDTLPHTYKLPTDADYDEWVTHIDPTCMTNGYTYKKCTVCEKWIEDTSMKIPAGEEHHAWVIVAPAVVGSCTVVGKTELKTCSVCRTTVGGTVVTGTGEGHNEVEVTFAGNCMKEAYTFTYCTNSFCDVAKQTSLTLGATTVDLTAIATDGVKILSYTVGVKNADVHNIGWYTTKVATCKSDGHEVEKCLDCLVDSTATGRYRDIPMGDEYCNFGTRPVQGATCTEKAVWECVWCEREEKRGEPLGHDYTNQPTLSETAHCVGTSGAGVNGYKYQLCKNCGVEKNILEEIIYNTTYIFESEEEARAQHTLPAGFKAVYVQGDCEKQGLWTLGNCSVCNHAVLMVDEETGHGHTRPTDATLITVPTCTTAGGYVCQNSYCSLPNKWVAEAALGHTLEKVAAKQEDCVNDGNIEHYKCTRTGCGKILVASADLAISADGLSLTLPAFNLLPEMWVSDGKFVATVSSSNIVLTIGEETADGTYTIVANVEYTFIVEDGKFVAALVNSTGSVVINKLGHHTAVGSLGFTESTLNPSNVNNCLDFAFTNVKWCARCAYSEMYGYNAATGHDYSENEEDLIFDECEKDGYYVCGNGCGVNHVVEGSAKGHKNSDGDYFFSGCQDTEDNRHCVVCCITADCDGECAEGLIPNTHKFYVLIDDAPATCDQPGYDLEVCEICEYEHIVINEPAHNHLNGAAMVWNDYTEDGKIKGVCSLCGFVDYKTGVSFEIQIDNANHAGAGYTTSSLIEVTVNLCATEADTLLRGFNFCLLSDGVLFVDYEYVSEDFDIYAVTSPENTLTNANGVITVNGMASNNRLGEKQNVEVTGKNAVIKLYFRVMSADDVAFYIPSVHEGDSDAVSAWKYTYDAETDAIVKGYTYGGAAYAEVKGYMDITIDGAITMTDVLEAYEMISNPDEGESTYNVVMDVNKDGEVTLIDLQAIMEYKSNNADYQDMLEMGISEEELALIEMALNP